MPDPLITVHPSSQVVPEGGNVTLSVTVTGTGPFSYQWQKDGVDITDENDPTLALTGVTESAEYRVLVIGSVGAALSNAALVLIGTVGGGAFATISQYDDVTAMEAGASDSLSIAMVHNWTGTDRTSSLWVKSTDAILVANGLDVVTTASGITMVRFPGTIRYG